MSTRGRTDLIFFGLVRGGYVSQILDDLLGVLCLPSTRLSSVTESQRVERGSGLKDCFSSITRGMRCLVRVRLKLTCKEWTGLRGLQKKCAKVDHREKHTAYPKSA